MKPLRNTVERIYPVYYRCKEKYLLYLRHLFAYEYVSSQLSNAHSVLEIGFGDGYGARHIATCTREVVAIDVDETVVQYAREKHGSPTCRFQCYDGRTIPFTDNTFDAVVSMQVIEHVQDDVQFVQEAYRVLKQGGTFWLTTPNRTHRVPPGGKVWNAFHVREYYPEEFEVLLRRVFTDVTVLGVRGTDEVQRIEHNRVKRGFSLRKLIPESVKGWLDGEVERRYSTADLYVIDKRIEQSLDLLGRTDIQSNHIMAEAR